jgi:hypothetical protein
LGVLTGIDDVVTADVPSRRNGLHKRHRPDSDPDASPDEKPRPLHREKNAATNSGTEQ